MACSDNILTFGVSCNCYIVAVSHKFLLNGCNHQLKHGEALVGICRCRILSSKASQADSALKLIHSVNVIHPLAVNNTEENHSFHFSEPVGTDFLFLFVVELAELLVETLLQGFRIHVGQILAVKCQRLEAAGDILQPLVHSIEIPFLRILRRNNNRINNLVYKLANHHVKILSQILTEENLLSLSVDDFPLLVHYIVILQDVLSDAEVSSFHLLLGILYLLRNHARLDGFVFLHAQFLNDSLHPLSAEETHEIVLH